MIDSLESLHRRLRVDPETHLGRKSVEQLYAYEIGYDLARERHGLPLLRDTSSFDWNAFNTTWVQSHFAWPQDAFCRYGVISFVRLFAASEADEFDRYFRLMEQAAEELSVAGPRDPVPDDGVPPPSLVEFLQTDRIRNRPAVYFGSPSIDALWALCSGYLWAEHDLGRTGTADALAVNGFQEWIDRRYPFAARRPWNRVLDFLALNHPERACKLFFDLWDSYRAGDPPDAPSATAKVMLASITRDVLQRSPGADPREIAESFTDQVKRMAP